MDAPSFSGTVNLRDSRAASHRPLCLGTEQPIAGILRSRTGPKGLGIRRIFHQLGKHVRICIPTIIPAPPGNNENRTGAVQGDPDSPHLAWPTLVPEINSPPGASPTDSSQATGSVPPAPLSDSTSRGLST